MLNMTAIYKSIQGESIYVRLPCLFFRLNRQLYKYI